MDTETGASTILMFVPPVNTFCNPVAEISPSVISIFVLPVKSQYTTSSTILMFVPPVNSFCNPVAEIIPYVISMFVLPTKSHEISLSTILIFVPSDDSSCLFPISDKRLFVPTKN